MIAALEPALAACDDLGITIRMEAGKLIWRAGDAGFPDDVRAALRQHRAALAAVLTDHPRPDPDPVLFVARNLDVAAYPLDLTRTVPAVWSAGRPYYRLTPRVWVWLAQAVDHLAAGPQGAPPGFNVAEAADLVANRLGRWVGAHYRPDQIRRAVRLARPLPELVPPPGVAIGKHQNGSTRTGTTGAAEAARLPAADRIPA